MQKTSRIEATKDTWRRLVAKYQRPNAWKSIWQVVNSFVPFFLVWYLMYLSLSLSYIVTLLLGVIAGGFLVRIFIIQHDCGHGSFFKGRTANDLIGSVCGVLTLTPYYYWRKSHSIHHANAGNLEHRGVGDIFTMTVREYMEQSKWGQFKYRLYRNPFVLFTVIPTVLFIVLYRFPHPDSKRWKRERTSVYMTNIALAAIVTIMGMTIGWKEFFMVQLPISIFAATVGTWFFYVQHQFEDTYYAGGEDWDYTLAALQGSSYYQLPRVLQWFTGNIGFHHIHHLSPRIPNYLLQRCHEENPLFQNVATLTPVTSVKSIFLTLWDEERKKLISFSQLNQLQTSLNPQKS
jgi:omega-6 fatty acid desaturase (delta-12 desaturase)